MEVRADPDHPLGAMCRRGRHAPEIVHSEHRLRTPLRRTGAKGEFAFEPISWEEAYELIAERLQTLKEESGPEAVGVYTGRGAFELSLCDLYQPKGVAISSASSVLFPFGSPNTFGVGALCYVAFAMIAPHTTLGRYYHNLFSDIEHAGAVLVWGANPATDSPPRDLQRLEAAAARGARIVVIDPRRTETAERTGAEWVPIRPGTDGALALGLIQVLLEEDRYDEPFAEQWCHGFDDLARYVQHFHPEVVAVITGVPAEKVRELARLVAESNGCCPVMYTGLEYSNTGVQAVRAVLTLFALAGQLDVPGGIGLTMAGGQFPINRSCNQPNPDTSRAIARDRLPLYTHYREESHPLGLVDAVLKGEPYPLRGLIVQGASLLTSWPQTPIWRETLAGLDFLVCIDRQRTADMDYADVVLPATTMFEIDSYMTYGPVFRLREKLIEPVGEARGDYRIMADLAQRLGYGHLFPQEGEEVQRFVLEGSGFTLEQVREAGGWVRRETPMMEYRKWEKGVLRADGQPGFDTPTGRFEIASTLLEDFGYEPLPRYTEVREGPLGSPELLEAFPLVFNSGARPDTDFRSQHHGIPGLVKAQPEPVVELHSQDAGRHGIGDGDLVEVATPRGAVPFRARVGENIMPGTVECNMGGGTPVGPPAWQAWNVNELTDIDNYDPISGFPVYKALLCRIRRLEPGTPRPRPRRRVAGGRHRQTPPGRERVYLDNNATTAVAPAVREAMLPWLGVQWGNPSSLHRDGRMAHEAVESARRELAALIGARPRRLVFTGGGSEANNLAIKGIAFSAATGAHLITSRVEHPAVLKTCHFLERMGWRVSYLPVDNEGRVRPEVLRRAITGETALVSIMLANNEVGTIQPIAELAAMAREHGVPFHTDAVQAVGKSPVDVEALGVDLLSLSAHKFHGPKGVGALYVRKGLELEALVHGGGQEGGLRAGTENVAGIAGLGRAAVLAGEWLGQCGVMQERRDRLEAGLMRLVPGATRNGSAAMRLPNTLNLTLPGLRGESLVIALDQHGIACSSGSACKSGSPEPTHVLKAMGLSDEAAHCSLRLSLSHHTDDEAIGHTLDVMQRVLTERSTSVRFIGCK
ncbi:cysteine desulfurase NifS [Thiohalomonas denitrificans]|uniref:cysteine desulfurase n=2 Tax=Thiohalomonas denitrificans TaxID=415747 RepID=A0A1G5QK56_9GAMM|nr:cysteine desulfurase NifS [Thiohalomonas denitrificans]